MCRVPERRITHWCGTPYLKERTIRRPMFRVKKDRKRILEERLYLLSIEQLNKIISLDENLLCHDEFNFNNKKQTYCPLAVALGVPELIDSISNIRPTNELVTELIKFKAHALYGKDFILNPTKGVEGEFYHGTNVERDRDLKQLIREIVEKKERYEKILEEKQGIC